MATLNLTKNTTVDALRKEFFTAFGAQIKLYNGNKRAEMGDTLGNLGLTVEGEFECRSSITVASFIERMAKNHGLKVKVYTCDEWVAVLDGLTLESAGKVKKNAVKADMESLKANYGVVKEIEVTIPRDHLCAPRRSDGTYYIDEIFTWDKQEIYKDVAILIFPKTGDVAFEKCNEISCSITRDDLPSIKEVRIPKNWKDALVVPKGVKKTYY